MKSECGDGNVVLMVVDVAFDSIGLNYFSSIVPKAVVFENTFVKNAGGYSLDDLSELPHEQVKSI